MPNHTLQILRLLRFAGLMLLLGSVAPAYAQTVGERAKKDPDFRIYPVISVSQPRPTQNPQWFDCPRWEPLETNGPRVGTRRRLISQTHG